MFHYTFWEQRGSEKESLYVLYTGLNIDNYGRQLTRLYIRWIIVRNTTVSCLCQQNSNWPHSWTTQLKSRTKMTLTQSITRDSIKWLYSFDKSSYIRSVYSQRHVVLLKCTEHNLNHQTFIQVSQLYVHVFFCL